MTYLGRFIRHQDNPFLTKGAAETWEAMGIRDPMLLVNSFGYAVREDGKYIMYYNGRDKAVGEGGVTQIGRATSPDGIAWTKEASNPVFKDGDYTFGGSVIKRGAGDYILYYTMDGANTVNYATSTDGLTWAKNTNDPVPPILDGADVEVASYVIPNVVQIGNTQYMVVEADWPFNIYMAKATDWKTWQHVGKIYDGTIGTWDDGGQANPSLYALPDSTYIIVYNGYAAGHANEWDIGILKSNNLEEGWAQKYKNPVLVRGSGEVWDSTRIEGGRFYMDDLDKAHIRMWYFGLPSMDSFEDGAIGLATLDLRFLAQNGNAIMKQDGKLIYL